MTASTATTAMSAAFDLLWSGLASEGPLGAELPLNPRSLELPPTVRTPMVPVVRGAALRSTMRTMSMMYLPRHGAAGAGRPGLLPSTHTICVSVTDVISHAASGEPVSGTISTVMSCRVW